MIASRHCEFARTGARGKPGRRRNTDEKEAEEACVVYVERKFPQVPRAYVCTCAYVCARARAHACVRISREGCCCSLDCLLGISRRIPASNIRSSTLCKCSLRFLYLASAPFPCVVGRGISPFVHRPQGHRHSYNAMFFGVEQRRSRARRSTIAERSTAASYSRASLSASLASISRGAIIVRKLGIVLAASGRSGCVRSRACLA